VVCQQGKRGVTVVPHAAVEDANTEQAACLDEVLLCVHVLVHLCQAPVHVPQADEPDGGCRTHHTVFLVLVDPLDVLVVDSRLHDDELVLAEPRIHERVHKTCRQILASRVDASASGGAVLHQVGLEHVLGRLGLQHVHVLPEVEVALRQAFVVHQRRQLLVVLLHVLVHRPQDEGQLLLHEGVFAAAVDAVNCVLVAQLNGNAQRIRGLIELHVNVQRKPHEAAVLGLQQEVRAARHVQAHAGKVGLLHVRHDLVCLADLQQQVQRVGLRVVLHEKLHNDVNKLLDRRGDRQRLPVNLHVESRHTALLLLNLLLPACFAGLPLFLARLPLGQDAAFVDDLLHQMAHKFVAPAAYVRAEALQLEFERLVLFGIRHSHGHDRHDVCHQLLVLRRDALVKELLQLFVVGTQELEWLGDGCH